MDNNLYSGYIEDLIPETFSNIYIIDMMSDLVSEYAFENKKFICKNTLPFVNFFSELQNIVHPDDLDGYVKSISADNLREKMEQGIKCSRYEYRKKISDNNYDWYSNVIKLIETDDKKVALVLVENINENIKLESKSSIDTLETKQKILFDAVTDAIVKLNGVMNINCTTNNPEIKSLTGYVNNVLADLTNSVPDLSKAMTENMISAVNQGNTKTIIIVDDDNVTCNLLSKTFDDIYKVLVAHDGQEAIDILEKNSDINNIEEKDKIIGMFLDLNMPGIDGFGVLDYMSSKNLLTKMPVVIISGDYDQATKEKAYTYPIADVLEKPFNVQIVKHRIGNLIKLYKSNNSLNEIVLTQHEEIKNVLRMIVKSYLYDYATDVKRVSSYVNVLAHQVSEDYAEYKFDGNRIAKLTEASKYYNIGLYTLPHKMFNKQNFNDDEIKIIKSHPMIGLSIFDSVLYRITDRIFNHYAKDIIEYHEENYDGTGYPTGAKGDDIPIAVQIASVAIEYNELLKVMNESSIIDEISKKAGTKFNPKVVESLKKVSEKIKEINTKI